MFAKLISSIRETYSDPDHGIAKSQINNYINEIKSTIAQLKASLRDKERVTYMCKVWRARLASKWFVRDYSELKKPFIDAYKKEFGEDIGPAINLGMEEIIHYFSLPIPAIKNMRFTGKSPSRIMYDLVVAEDDWRTSLEGKGFVDNDSKVLIDFKDGWVWVMTNTAYSAEEACSMGHCGNEPAKDSPDRILSLRRNMGENADGDTIWRPSLTFILHENGHLGEMKGRGNGKPTEKYHEMITALLLLPLIKGIDGGGYLPQNNFALSDLTEEEAYRVIKAKPNLADFYDVVKLYRNKDLPLEGLVTRFKQELAIHKLKVVSLKGDHLVCFSQPFDKAVERWNTPTKALLYLTFHPEREIPLFEAEKTITEIVHSFEKSYGEAIPAKVVASWMPKWLSHFNSLKNEIHEQAKSYVAPRFAQNTFDIKVDDRMELSISFSTAVTLLVDYLQGEQDDPYFRRCIAHEEWTSSLWVDDAVPHSVLIREYTQHIYHEMSDIIERDLKPHLDP